MENIKHTISYFNASYGTIFWDEKNKIITSIHENDATYRREYFDKLFTHFGIKVQSTNKPIWLTENILIQYGIE